MVGIVVDECGDAALKEDTGNAVVGNETGDVVVWTAIESVVVTDDSGHFVRVGTAYVFKPFANPSMKHLINSNRSLSNGCQ